MDYCSSCRRHLNGALVCPGCGAYAPDIDPALGADPLGPAPSAGRVSLPGPPASGPVGTAAAWETAAAAFPDDDASLGAPGTVEQDADIAFDGGTAPTGRAARRRQRARWQKNRRRAAVATAVALVGGGLTVTALDRGSGSRAQAATTPDERSMGVAEEPAQGYAPPAGPGPRGSAAPSAPGRTAGSAPSAGHTDAASAPSAAPATRVRPQSAVPAQPVAHAAPQPHAVAPRQPSGVQDTVPAGGTSTPPATQPTAPSGSGGGTAPTAPAPAPTATSPSSTTPSQDQLCLLVVCLG
ncbi:SCO2400 family protein [Streptomyces sp. NPDC003299]